MSGAGPRPGVTLVTGGSRGIGRAIVERLVEDGRRVAFTFSAHQPAADEVAEASGDRARAFQLDLRDRDRPKALVSEIEELLGPVEALVNNAGIQKSGLLAMTGDQDWDDVLDVNLGGAFRCCRAVLPGMVRRRRGAIVAISSLGAVRGVAGQSAYAASKAGLLAMTRCLAREMGKRNIRVNAVVPGLVATDMTADLAAGARAVLESSVVLPAGVEAGAVADAVLFLLSERAAAITGQSLHVDAGASA